MRKFLRWNFRLVFSVRVIFFNRDVFFLLRFRHQKCMRVFVECCQLQWRIAKLELSLSLAISISWLYLFNIQNLCILFEKKILRINKNSAYFVSRFAPLERNFEFCINFAAFVYVLTGDWRFYRFGQTVINHYSMRISNRMTWIIFWSVGLVEERALLKFHCWWRGKPYWCLATTGNIFFLLFRFQLSNFSA